MLVCVCVLVAVCLHCTAQFDPVFGLLASASQDGTVRVWDTRGEYPSQQRVVRSYYGCIVRLTQSEVILEHRRAVASVAAPASSAAAAHHAGSLVKVTCVDHHPRGQYLATGSDDGVVRVFQLLAPRRGAVRGGASRRTAAAASAPALASHDFALDGRMLPPLQVHSCAFVLSFAALLCCPARHRISPPHHHTPPSCMHQHAFFVWAWLHVSLDSEVLYV